MELLLTWIVLSIAIYATAYILPGVTVTGLFASILVAMFMGIVNTIIKPILIVLTLPLNILTLGLFTLVINALLVLFVAAIVPGFKVNNFWWAMAFSIILAVINGFLLLIIK